MKLNTLQSYVLSSVEAATGLNDIRQITRKREYVDARRVAYLIFRNIHNMTYMEIANLFSRTHATVIYAVQSAENLIETDPAFRDIYFESLASITGCGTRMMEIVNEIKELKKEFLTLQKEGHELHI